MALCVVACARLCAQRDGLDGAVVRVRLYLDTCASCQSAGVVCGCACVRACTALVLTQDQKWKLLPEIMKTRGLLRQHINSFNNFIDVEMAKVVAANNEVKSDTARNFYLRWVLTLAVFV